MKKTEIIRTLAASVIELQAQNVRLLAELERATMELLEAEAENEKLELQIRAVLAREEAPEDVCLGAAGITVAKAIGLCPECFHSTMQHDHRGCHYSSEDNPIACKCHRHTKTLVCICGKVYEHVNRAEYHIKCVCGVEWRKGWASDTGRKDDWYCTCENPEGYTKVGYGEIVSLLDGAFIAQVEPLMCETCDKPVKCAMCDKVAETVVGHPIPVCTKHAGVIEQCA